MKKTWIKIKRGLLKPEHRERLGVRVWLYLYMIDKVDWDTGILYGWKDKDEAKDFGMPWRTLQQQRQQLEEDGYITCEQKAYHQNITIHKWINPREYSGEEYNPIYGDTEDCVPTDGSTENYVPLESTMQGTNEGDRKPSTPTLSSHITYHEEEGAAGKFNGGSDAVAIIARQCEALTGSLNTQSVNIIGDWVDNYPRLWIEEAIKIAIERNAKHPNYVTKILEGWNKDGKNNGFEKSNKKQSEPAGYAGIRAWLEKEDGDDE